MRAMNNTWDHFQDNRVQWLLGPDSRAHLRAYVAAGFVGFLFGRGADGSDLRLRRRQGRRHESGADRRQHAHVAERRRRRRLLQGAGARLLPQRRVNTSSLELSSKRAACRVPSGRERARVRRAQPVDSGVQRPRRHGRTSSARPAARRADAHGRRRRGAQLGAARPHRRTVLRPRRDRAGARGITQPRRAPVRQSRGDPRDRHRALDRGAATGPARPLLEPAAGCGSPQSPPERWSCSPRPASRSQRRSPRRP